MGVEKLKIEGVGGVAVSTKTTNKLDKDKCKELLVSAGVDPTVVADCFKKSTTTIVAAKETVTFRPTKKK